MAKNYILLGFVLLCNSFLVSQETKIRGFVTDFNTKRPVSNAVVTLAIDSLETEILDYVRTSKDGSFSLKYNFSKKSEFWISVRHISYNTIQKKLSYKNQSEYNFSLTEKVNTLEEIVVKSKRDIIIKGDTISYTTDGLATKKDVTIEDVIARIPGIEISKEGRITYNNRLISHLYINGIDLLEGRYNIATRSIPASTVEQIDVLKKHNHAKIDRNFTFSDKVALNLQLKEDRNLIFGKSKLNTGTPLLIREIDLTPIFIDENAQDILTVKHNNIGKSLQYNGANFIPVNLELGLLNDNEIKILEPPNTNGSYLDEINWLNNNSTSFTNDILFKNNNDFTNKLALTYNDESSRINKKFHQTFFFGNDTSTVINNFDNVLKLKKFNTSVIQEINKEKLYLKNKLHLEKVERKGVSEIEQNNDSLNYLYTKDFLKIENTTNVKVQLNDKVLSSDFFFGFYDNNEQNFVTPSVFDAVFQNINEAEQTSQNIFTKQIYLGGVTKLDFNYKRLKTTLKQRIFWKKEELNSNLKQLPVNSDEIRFPFVTNYKQSLFESKTTYIVRYKVNKWHFFIEPELNYITLQNNHEISENNVNQNYFIFQPSIRIQHRLNEKWNLTLSNSLFTTLSQFEELYSGLILRSFNRITTNPNKVNVTKNNRSSFLASYSDILNGFMFSNYFYYVTSSSDFISNTNLNDEGFFNTEALKFDNNRFSISNTTKFEKSFFNLLKTELTYTFNKTNFNQIFNNVFQEQILTNHYVNLKLNIDNGTWYNFGYDSELNIGNTESDTFKTNNIFLKHKLNLDLFLNSKSRLNIASETVQTQVEAGNSSSINSLLNIGFYFKPSKKMVMNLKIHNIFNQKFFFTNINNPNFISESRFILRPRQVTVGLEFLF